MQLSLLALAVLVCAAVASAQDSDADASSARRELAEANNAFALQLYQALRPLSGNAVLSPLSLMAVLALTWLGTRGSTAQQLRAALHVPESHERVADGMKALLDTLQASEGIVVRIANRLFVQQDFPVKQSFRDLALNSFRSDAQSLDFRTENEAARQTINQWVEQNTEGKIKDLFESGALSVDAVLVLVNAIYFKGEWAKAFQENRTSDETFHVSADTSVNVPMMNGVLRTGYARIPEFNVSVLELPYKSSSARMLIILPDEVDGLQQLEDNLGAMNLSHYHLFQAEVQVQIPKFKVETTLSLKENLETLGVTHLFSTDCDVSGITDHPNVQVSKVLQKAYVEVNEKGTEAAVASGVVGIARSGRRRGVFTANHPFLFLIQGAERGILFMGRVTNPSL